jgi:hypothetical protein
VLEHDGFSIDVTEIAEAPLPEVKYSPSSSALPACHSTPIRETFLACCESAAGGQTIDTVVTPPRIVTNLRRFL